MFFSFSFFFFFGLLPFVLIEGHNALESYQEFIYEGTVIIQRGHPGQPEGSHLAHKEALGASGPGESRKETRTGSVEEEEGPLGKDKESRDGERR